MLAASPVPDAEEWAIHDHEGFHPIAIHEYADIEEVCAMAAFIDAHGELGAALIDHLDRNVETARRALEKHYAGCFCSLADFAQELIEDTSSPLALLAHYIDYDAMACDMSLNGAGFTIEAGFESVQVFWARWEADHHGSGSSNKWMCCRRADHTAFTDRARIALSYDAVLAKPECFLRR